MNVMKVLVTGSSGLIGSEAVVFYDREGHTVIGVDNNMRAKFFGPSGDTTWNLSRLKQVTRHFTPYNIDIREREQVFDLFKTHCLDLIVHCAAQPSHDKAREIPLLDFEINALGTMNLLEATRQFCPEAVFIHMSTNKVYGDAPNELSLVELEKRYDYADPENYRGITEECRVDRCIHTVFGASSYWHGWDSVISEWWVWPEAGNDASFILNIRSLLNLLASVAARTNAPSL